MDCTAAVMDHLSVEDNDPDQELMLSVIDTSVGGGQGGVQEHNNGK